MSIRRLARESSSPELRHDWFFQNTCRQNTTLARRRNIIILTNHRSVMPPALEVSWPLCLKPLGTVCGSRALKWRQWSFSSQELCIAQKACLTFALRAMSFKEVARVPDHSIMHLRPRPAKDNESVEPDLFARTGYERGS